MERPSEGHTDKEKAESENSAHYELIFLQTSTVFKPVVPSLLQETMGLGFPVAMHSKMAVWWTLMVRFWGPDRMTGSL